MVAMLIIGAMLYTVGGMYALYRLSPLLSPESEQPSELEI
jgi:hypothetical protein